MAEASKLSHNYVLDGLKFIAKECMKLGKSFNPTAANKSLELIGKHLGTFDPKTSELEERPAFVGINIIMGDKPRAENIYAKPKDIPTILKEKPILPPAPPTGNTKS